MALKYFSVQSPTIQESYILLRDKFRQRFGHKDEPVTIRQQIQHLKQNEDESLEEFAERMHSLATDEYPATVGDMVETIATDGFLKGCSNKQATLTAIDKQPVNLHSALQMMKIESSNQCVLLGEHFKFKMCRVHFSDALCLEPDLLKIWTVQLSSNPSHSSDMSDLCTLMKDMKADNASLLKLLQQMVRRTPSLPWSPGSRQTYQIFCLCGHGSFLTELSGFNLIQGSNEATICATLQLTF